MELYKLLDESKKIKLIVFDIDGTIKKKGVPISSKTIELLNRLSKLVPVTFATARTLLSVRQCLKGLEFELPAVCCNGLSVIDINTGNYINKFKIDNEICNQMLEFFTKDFNLVFEDGIYIYANNINAAEIYSKYYKFEIDNIKIIEKLDQSIEPSSILVMDKLNRSYHICEDQYRQADKLLKGNIKGTKKINRDWYHIMESSSSKGNGVKILCDNLGFKSHEVMVFGDEINDLEMFEFAGISIAVSNAKNELKKIATYSINADIEEVIEKLINIFGED